MLPDNVMDVAGPFFRMEINMMAAIARVAVMALVSMFSGMALVIMDNIAVVFVVVVASSFIRMDPSTRATGAST